MNRWLAVAVVAAMLAVPAVAATTYPQTGYDSGRTGAIDFQGPTTNDTVFEVDLPGSPLGQPVVDGDRVLLVTYDLGFEDLTERALWSIDLSTGNTTKLMDVPDGAIPLLPNSLVHEGHLLVWDRDTYDITALEIPSGEESWRAGAFDVPPQAHPGNGYDGSVRVGDVLYAGYWMNLRAGDVSGVIAVDLESGERLWRWDRQQETREDNEVADRATPAPVPDALGGPDRLPASIQLSADQDRVYAYLWHASPRQQGELWAIDAATGETRWDHHDEMQTGGGYGSEGWAAVTPLRVYVRFDAFQAFNPETGEELWTSPAGRTDQIEMQGGTPVGATSEAVVATSPQSVYRMDPETGDVVWRHTLTDFTGSYPTGETPMIGEETAYIPLSTQDGEISGRGIEARDLETGDRLWRWTDIPAVGYEGGINFSPSKLAHGPGVALISAKDGTVHVIGRTQASLGEPDVDTERYPAPGEQVTIDASGAEPGAFGEATRYMVDWGDGTVTGWQESPMFTHTYNETSEHEAQVYAGNAANQTSSTVVTMNVGGEEPSWVGDQFQHHQDRTYGVLGLAVAVTGGAIGVARRYRERSRLQEELEALEDGFEDTRGNVGECEALLETRKARARSLVLDGVLTEEQFGVIESRIGELRSQLRTELLDERLQFLPHGMVQSLKGMLADGEISAWEQDTFERLLEEDETLNEAQRETVRRLLERWSEASGDGGVQA